MLRKPYFWMFAAAIAVLGIASFTFGDATSRRPPIESPSQAPQREAADSEASRRGADLLPSGVAAPKADVPDPRDREIERLRFENKIRRAQLTNLIGEPVAWPLDVPEKHSIRAAEERLRRITRPFEDQLSEVELDCSEFPCIAIVASAPGTELPRLEGDFLEDFDDPVLLTACAGRVDQLRPPAC